MPPPSHSRRSSGASSRGRSGASGDQYHKEPQLTEAAFDFCNAFWSFSGRKPLQDSGRGDTYEGKEGYDVLMARMKAGTRTLEDLRAMFKERATMEEDYAKRLQRLSKSPAGQGESGHIERAIRQIKEEIEASSKAHGDFAVFLRSQDAATAEFLHKRENTRKAPQSSVEKAFKVKREQREMVNKAKSKYEADAINMTGMSAHAALSQGRDLDKVNQKMDKIAQTVLINERDYKRYVDVLKETTGAWNTQWKQYCDLCQDQEEERLAFVKAKMWDWANALSTVAMTEDESSERSRMALEQCDPVTDLQIFVQMARTGDEIPDPPPFVDYRSKDPPPKQAFKAARFPRSSTRGGAIKHSPSTVEDITRVFKTPPPGAESQPRQQQQAAAAAAQKRASQSQGPPGGAIGASVANHALDAPQQRPNFAPDAVSPVDPAPPLGSRPPQFADPLPPAQPALRPAMGSAASNSSLFNPSRHAAAKPRNESTDTGASMVKPPSPAGKPGFAAAGVFKRRNASNSNLEAASSGGNSESASPAPARYDTMASVKTDDFDNDDDPIARALAKMQAEAAPAQPIRNSRSFSNNSSNAGPAPGAVPLPGMVASPNQHHQQRQSQQFNRPMSANFSQSPSTQNFPTATHMQAPPGSQYGQPGYGAGGGGSGSRPPSRQGSATPNRMSSGPPVGHQGGLVRSPSPQPYAGIGARGSMSSQPGGRAPSPHIQRGPSPSPQPGQIYSPPPGQGPPPPQQQPWQQGGPPHQPQQQQPGMQRFQSPSQHQLQLDPVRTISPLAFSIPANAAPQGAHGRTHSASLGSAGGPPAGYPSQFGGPPPTQYGAPGYSQPPPQGYAPSPTQPGSYGAPPTQQFAQNGYRQPSPAPAQQPAMYRQPSPAPAQQPAMYRQPSPAPAQQQQQFRQPSPAPVQQQQQYRQPSPAPAQQQAYGQQNAYRQPSPAPVQAQAPVSQTPPQSQPPNGMPQSPTGQYDAQGRPILFYVNAIYDYQAAGPDEFSFSKGDVIGVVATDPDGWWQGQPVGVSTGGHVFPSNFTELLS